MTFIEMCQKFREMVGISGSGPATVLDQTGMNKKITTWIADADMLVQRKWEDWDFLLQPKVVITAIASTSTFTPSDLSIDDLSRWKKNTFVRNPGASGYSLLDYSMTFDDYLRSSYYLGAATTGAIEGIVIRPSDDAVIFYPTPAVTTPVWAAYYKTPTRMSLDASGSPIPAKLQDIVIYRAKMFYAEHLEDIALYNSALRDFKNIMSDLEAIQLPGFKGKHVSANDTYYQDIVVE